jgi:transcriptional regulator with XRE-family HTH domain
MSLTATAGLAGMSVSYLSRIERGLRPVTKRATLEALARALRVSPTELTGKPYAPSNAAGQEADAALLAIETALECLELGTDPEVPSRPWPELAVDITRIRDLRHVNGDYAGLGAAVPPLAAELHGTYVRDQRHRRGALLGLIHCYYAMCSASRRLGGRGLPLLAARLAQQCAHELDAPEWVAYTAFLRVTTAGELSRPHQYTRSVAAADGLRPHLADAEVAQEYGMLHLSASLAAAAQGDGDTCRTHLAEAQAVAERQDEEVGTFGRHWFGRTNVGIWRIALGIELGEGPAAIAATARDVHPELIPSPSRQADFYSDLGRSLLNDTRLQDEGLAALLRAEALAPQSVHTDVFVRDAVASTVTKARRDSGGRQLRGLAHRMGIAPIG